MSHAGTIATAVPALDAHRPVRHGRGGGAAHLSAPVAVRPFGTVETSSPAHAVRGRGSRHRLGGGGSGREAAAETSTLGSSGPRGYSFLGQGRPIRIVGEQR